MNRDSILDFKFKKYNDIVKNCSSVEYFGIYKDVKMCNQSENTFNYKICCPENCYKININELLNRD